MKKKALVVFGTRPEAIKMCPLVKELYSRESIETRVCVTGQHKEMLQVVMDIFKIKPHYDLDIMKDKQTLFDVTQSILTGMEEVLDDFAPDIVFVHGDTCTAFAAALAAFYKQIDVAHVEAGLRTKDMYSPFPEEYYRQSIDLISKFYFAPTNFAKSNLISEGKKEDTVFVTGNTGIDTLKDTVSKEYSNPVLDWAGDSKLIMLTAHRRENLGDPMRNMFRAIKRVVNEHEDIKVIYPVHLNPKVKQVAKEELGDETRIKLIDPLGVVDFHNFLSKSYLILTDSGGIQEEAPFLGKPVLVMRDTTERPEGVSAGTLKLVGTDEETIYNTCCTLLDDKTFYEKMSMAKNPYGDGTASIQICDIIEQAI